MCLKQMQLCDTNMRNLVDLRNYADQIEKSVSKVMPSADVEVNEKYFTILSNERQTYSEAVKIGRIMGQTELGKFTKKHLYTYSQTQAMGVSNKIFIEVKKPKGRIIIDDGVKEREILEVLAEMSEDTPVQEPCNYDEIPIEDLEYEETIPFCEYVMNENYGEPETYLNK